MSPRPVNPASQPVFLVRPTVQYLVTMAEGVSPQMDHHRGQCLFCNQWLEAWRPP